MIQELNIIVLRIYIPECDEIKFSKIKYFNLYFKNEIPVMFSCISEL